MRQQRCKAGPDAIVHIGRNILTLGNSGLHNLDLGSLPNLLEASDEDGRRSHCSCQHDPEERKRVEKSDVLRAKIIFIVSDRYVEWKGVGGQERSYPGHVVGTATSIELAALFTSNNPVVSHCHFRNGRTGSMDPLSERIRTTPSFPVRPVKPRSLILSFP